MSKENLTEPGLEPETQAKIVNNLGGGANVGLDSSVGISTGTSNQRSQVQTPVQSNFLYSSEIDLKLYPVSFPSFLSH